MEMVGHTSIVYSVDSHASGLIVSGSEDCSAKIWKGYYFYLEICEGLFVFVIYLFILLLLVVFKI